ncbi:MAG: hypothetical protein ABIV26_06995, partial [Candidatus Limnocylindrales bacterium]
MRTRLFGMLASAAIVLAACGSSASPSPSTTATGSAPAPTDAGTPGPTTAPEINLLGSQYKPDDGVDGGDLIFADWQEATQYNPFYVGQVTEANVASAVWASTILLTNDYKYGTDL